MIKWGRSRDGFGWYDTQRKAKAAAERATLTRT